MHPYVKFFDILASRMDKSDPKVARLLCGIRDQIDASAKGFASGRVKAGNTKSINSVMRSIASLMDNHGDSHPELRTLLAKFVQRVHEKGSLV